MSVKDYYQVLEIPHNATEKEIKTAYRKLVMQYHPDKNTGNPFAIQHFREVQEAYEILSNPVKRSEYHQLRWQHSVKDRLNQSFTVTPELLLKEAQKLHALVLQMDVFRMNQDAVFTQIKQLMNPRHSDILLNSTNYDLRRQFVSEIVQCMRPLNYPHWPPLISVLTGIAGADNDLLQLIYRAEKEQKSQHWWSRYKILLILLTVISLCAMIYLIA